MEFIYNPSVRHLAINEPIIYELFRSTAPYTPSNSEVSPGQCEAYICTCRESGKLSLYIAFWEMESKAVLIYEPASQPANNQDYKKVVEKAKEFVSGLGFKLEQKNLDYSTAMRQVILQTVKALKPPPNWAKPLKFKKIAPQESKKNEETPQAPQPVEAEPVETTAKARDRMAAKPVELVEPAAPGTKSASKTELVEQPAPATISVSKTDDKQAELANKAELDSLKRKLSEQTTLLDSLRSELENSQNEVKSINKKYSVALQTKDEEKGILESQIKVIEEQLLLIQSTREKDLEMRNEIQNATKRERDKIFTSLQRELEEEKSLRIQAENMAGKVPEMWEQLEHKEAALNTASLELEQLRNEMETMRSGISSELDRMQATIADKDSALNSANQQLKQLVQEAKTEKANLMDEIEKLRHQISDNESFLDTAVKQIEQAQESLKSTKKEHATLIRALEQERDALKTDNAKFSERLAELETTATQEREKTMRVCLELERKKESERHLRQEFANELDRMKKEKEEIEIIASAALAETSEERDMLIADLDSNRDENASLREALDAEIATSRTRESELTAEIGRYKREIMIREELSVREMSGLRAELRRMVEERAMENQDCVMIEAFSVNTSDNQASYSQQAQNPPPKQTEPPEKTEVDPETIIEEKELSEMFVGFPPEEKKAADQQNANSDDNTTMFQPNPSLKGIPCPSTESIVALYESANKIQTVPDGYKIQKSGSYICAVTHDGLPEIYLAWLMLESDQVLVYTPSKQPRSEEAYQRVLHDALFYFESVGFMMSSVDLSAPQSKARALKQIPVIRKRTEH